MINLTHKEATIYLPAVIGSNVYSVLQLEDEYELIKGKLTSYCIEESGIEVYCRYEGGLTYWHKLDDPRLFLTMQEAQQYLSKLKTK